MDMLILAMNSLLKFLKFTMEIAEQFEDGKLPTLDTKIWMENRRVWYMFFEKPMAANVLIQAESPLSEQIKLASLTQEVVRRLFMAKIMFSAVLKDVDFPLSRSSFSHSLQK